MRVKICVRAECSPELTFSTHGEQLREEVAKHVADGDRPVGAVDRDVDVEPERVVAPDDVAQDLVVAAVVRRVDDPLLLPGAPRVGTGGSEGNAQRLGEPKELRAPLGEPGGRLLEVVATPGTDLDLGRDQLPDQVLLERRVLGGGLELLEAVGQPERLRVEDRELLFDGKREVPRRLVLLAREADLLLGSEALGVSHGPLP
jgi:hypothetical protein